MPIKSLRAAQRWKNATTKITATLNLAGSTVGDEVVHPHPHAHSGAPAPSSDVGSDLSDGEKADDKPDAELKRRARRRIGADGGWGLALPGSDVPPVAPPTDVEVASIPLGGVRRWRRELNKAERLKAASLPMLPAATAKVSPADFQPSHAAPHASLAPQAPKRSSAAGDPRAIPGTPPGSAPSAGSSTPGN